MKIPSCFYGTYKKVKAEISKLYTQIKRGKPLDEIFSKFELLDTNDYPVRHYSRYDGQIMIPSNLIWLDRAWSMSGSVEHFILSPFWEKIFEQYDYETRFEKEKLLFELVSFFTQTEWGCALLNARGFGFNLITKKCKRDIGKNRRPFLLRYSIDPDLSLMVLESTVKYWDTFISYGKRFYIGGDNEYTFPKCNPESYFIIARLGCDTKEIPCEVDTDGSIYGDIKKIVQKYNLLEKLKNDEDFRKAAWEGSIITNMMIHMYNHECYFKLTDVQRIYEKYSSGKTIYANETITDKNKRTHCLKKSDIERFCKEYESMLELVSKEP